MRPPPRRFWFFLFAISIAPSFLLAQNEPSSVTGKAAIAAGQTAETKPPLPNLFAEQFFLKPNQRLQYQTTEVKGFVFVESPDREKKTRYAVVSDFGGSVLKTKAVPGVSSLEDARKWIELSLETATFQNVEIRKLTIPEAAGPGKTLYWVGHKSFATPDQARAQIALTQAAIEAQGGNFKDMVDQAQRYFQAKVEEPKVEIKTVAQQQKEEEIALKFLDQLDIGNELFGPLQGVGQGEKITWQSFGETTWRMTNLDKKNFSDQVGFWTNRIVFKGIRAPLSTIDPFVEATAALESNGNDSGSHLDLSYGAEWRPLSRNPWLVNFRPFWAIPILEWIRNYRFYVQYFDRKNLKDEIAFSRDYDVQAGVQIFYEWGIDLPPVSESKPSSIGDYLRQYVWGEYFGNYRWEWTDFTSEDDFEAWILNSSVILGFRTPPIPLPPNPINDELVLMPYLRFEHTNNTGFSFSYQNQYFVAAGLRWMPFRTYRFKENEWLSKTKIFAEWVGIGDVQNAKQDGEADTDVHHDLRFGVSLSQRRF